MKTQEDHFHALILPRRGFVERYALRLCRNPDDAEDLTQETMLRAYLSLATLKATTDREVGGWLRMIALNLYRSRYRHERLLGFVSLDALEPGTADAVVAHVESVEATVLRSMTAEAIQAKIGRCSPELARAITAVCIREETYQEAAETLNLPLGTVKTEVMRGRDWLRPRLENWK